MNYERINWENAPSTDTPLDADNLNKMDEALDTLNREVAKTRSDVQEVEETAASLGSQIAGIIRLEDGSTTGDAELINGRVGKDGTTYSTIGDAIRGQIGDLRDHVIEVSDEEPEEFYNKIWVNDSEDEIEIPTKAELDAVEDEVAELNERLDDVRAGIFADVDQSKITVSSGGRYINFSGVQGTANWSQLYQFDTEKGKDYYIYSYAPSVVPVLYFDGTAYPSSAQSADYRMGFVIRGNGQKAYINAVADNKVVVEQPIISEGRYLPYTNSLASAELELADIKNNFSINSRNGYYITAQGIQGSLGGYNLKYFVGEKGKVYYIKTQKRHAQSTIPLVYTDGTAYGVGEDSDILVFAGNNKTIYINTCEDFTYDIKEYVFTNYVDKPMFIDMFNDIVCCGDSLTYGLVYDTETSTRMANSPYPETLGKLTGCNITKLATSGFKASDWWNTYNQNITGSKKLYLIYLGTNGAITDTVDTDCVGDDYTQYAETETGYYGRIIQKIKDTGSSCIIVKIAKGTSAISNPSLVHMAERFNVPIVDNPATGNDSPLSNMYYHYGSTTDYYNTVHMNDLGYAVFANMLLDNIKNLTIAEQYSIMPK